MVVQEHDGEGGGGCGARREGEWRNLTLDPDPSSNLKPFYLLLLFYNYLLIFYF